MKKYLLKIYKKKYNKKIDPKDLLEKLRYIKLEETDLHIYLYNKKNLILILIKWVTIILIHINGGISVGLDIEIDYINNSIIKCKNVNIINKHSLIYYNHNFARKKEIKNDLK